MKPYNEIRRLCEKNSRMSAKLVDGFLIGYAARHQGLEKKMNQQFARYRHVTEKFDKGTVNMMKSQYIAHRIFREGGMIGKFLNNPALKRLVREERDYLEQQAAMPWRFSFSVITGEPEDEFFLMEDIFSELEYLVFSPGISQLKASRNPVLWLNLIGFNGSCWQSYGPIGAYNSFQPDDIYFFATELNPEIGDEGDIASHIETTPLPYMMLLSGAAYPFTFHKKEQMRYMMAEYDLDTLDTAALKKSFKTEYDSGVYRLSHKEWGEPPHMAQVYYDEKLKLILFTAMTGRGFRELVNGIKVFGYHFSNEPFISINTSMVVTAQNILQKNVVLNEYEELFHVEPDEGKQGVVDEMNAFMALVLPDINAGRMPNIEAAARKSGLAIETAHDLVNMVTGKLLDLPAGDAGAPQKEAALYREIYLLADEIRQMEPWKWMYEIDLFGVKIPGNNRVYFVSVMGANGQFFALSAYKGYQGLAQFVDFHEHAETMPPETILTIPHLMLSFTDREEMSREELDAIRLSHIKFRGKGKWPHLEEFVPGFTPIFPEGEILADLPLLLDQVAMVLHRTKEDPGYLFKEGDPFDAILVRSPSVSSDRLKWEDRYETFDPEWGAKGFHVYYSRETMAEVSRLSEGSQVVQVDLVMLPAPVKEKGKKGYFPFMLLLVDKQNGSVPGMTLLTPQPDLHSMYESIPQKILEEITKLGFRPKKIEIRSEILFVLLEKVLKEAYCSPDHVEQLPQLDEAVESLRSHLAP
ncbi:MAG: hypothetical protein ISS19_04485 [Bacteroidales bacterium]|nr:hypothetical protein [Bacteroidales bacterium]